MTLAPSLLGEVTHYVADIGRARDCSATSPRVPLDDGIALAVAWFREHRVAHADEDRPVATEDSEIGWKTYAGPETA